MRFSRRRLARGFVLAVVSLVLGCIVGFSSIYLGQFLGGLSTTRSAISPESAKVGLEKQAMALLDRLSGLAERIDSLLTRDALGISAEQEIERLRSQLYLLHIDLYHLMMKDSQS